MSDPRYKRDNPESTFALMIEHANGAYGKANPNAALTDPTMRKLIHAGLDSVMDNLATREVVHGSQTL